MFESDRIHEQDIPPSLDRQGRKKILIPAEVRGRFRRRRDRTQVVLMAVFFLLPWIHFRGEQIFHLDVLHRRFTFFGTTLFSHDAPLIFLVTGFVISSLFFVTVMWGRLWCGWACPQTVFIDGLYRKLEIWIEGNYLQRRAAQKAPWLSKSGLRRACKWFAFLIVSSFLAHSFIAYFVGSKTLLEMMARDPRLNWSYFVLISSVTTLLLFNFGWFREQFCVIACPYGRFQSLLLDSRSLTVLYDEKRGEPRRGSQSTAQPRGDCVNCRRCVEVCPTGLDIRQGLQMDCIACTACADACDEIMQKVKKPPGLIGYRSLENRLVTTKRLKPLLAAVVAVGCLLSLLIILSSRAAIDMTVLRSRGELFSVNDGRVINHFRLHLLNQTATSKKGALEMFVAGQSLTISISQNPIVLSAGETTEVHVFATFDRTLLKRGLMPAQMRLRSLVEPSTIFAEQTMKLIGPE